MTDLRIDLSTLGVPGPPSPDGRRSGRPGSTEGVGSTRWWVRVRAALFLAVPLLMVPLLLLRGSVHAHTAWGAGPWASVAAGMVFAAAILALGTWVVAWILRVPGAGRRLLARGAALAGIAFVLHGLLYVGVRNTKGDAVRREYRALHPLLRAASTVLVAVDRSAVLTDARRAPEDYTAMGLSPLQASLHYPQSDGYVHALDLRTEGRSELRNRLVAWGFRAMGMRVLRHVGTADHLHVSLPPGGRFVDAAGLDLVAGGAPPSR